MAKTLQLKRGTGAQAAANTPASGELYINTDQNTVIVGDGTTAGGFPLATQAQLNANVSTLVANTNTITLAGNLVIPGNLTVTGASTTVNVNTQIINQTEVVAGRLTANANLAAANTTSGSLVVLGGAGFSGNVFANSVYATSSTGAVYTDNLRYSANGSPWTIGTGTVASVSGTGSASGLSLSGTVTTTGSLTLSGSITGAAICSGLGYTPVCSSATQIAIGSSAGSSAQGVSAVAIGACAGQTNQCASTVAIGIVSGRCNQGVASVAVGYNAGTTCQGRDSLAIGENAGNFCQGNSATAVGYQAASTSQGTGSTAIGLSAGLTNQGNYAVAIGVCAGGSYQAACSIAIAAGPSSCLSNYQAVGNAGFYVDPIRTDNTNVVSSSLVYQNPTTLEVIKSTTLQATSGYVGSLYFANNIITPANTGTYSTTVQPVVINGGFNILPTSVSSNITATAGGRYFVNSAVTITLPTAPALGDTITIWPTVSSVVVDSGLKGFAGHSSTWTLTVNTKYEMIYGPTGTWSVWGIPLTTS
jgi:hypothetical protein